jgi:uncharacterized protein
MEQLEIEQYDTFTPPAAAPADTTEQDDSPVTVTDADGVKQLSGYAVVWGAISTVRRLGKRHRFSRGSIIWQQPTIALWNHDYSIPLASTENATLVITEDDYGALATITLDNTTDGQNAFQRVLNRLVTGMSFSGTPQAFAATELTDVLDVTSFTVREVSLTIIPAMVETNIVTAGNESDLKKSLQDQKDNGMSLQKNILDRIKLALMKP